MASASTATPPRADTRPSSCDTDTDGDAASASAPETRRGIDVARLGRERPAALGHPLTEAGFVFAVVSSMMLSEYFISGFNIVLPPLADALAMPPAARTWPAAVTNLATAALLLPGARLCDLAGGRAVFLAGHAWLLAWSVASGFARAAPVLVVCRAMQGVGAAAFLPAGLALLSRAYRPGPRKNLVFAVYGAFACVGFYFGIFMGAVAAEFLDWRWYFWIGAVLGLVVAATGALTIPRRLGAVDPAARMDWPGLVTIVPGLVLVVFAFTDGGHAPDGWRTPYVYVALVLGVLFLAAAVYVQGWVSSQPLLPPALFQQKYMKRLVAALFCSYGVFGLLLFYSSFYIETVMHTPPILTAAWFTPMAVGGMFLAIGGGFILHIVPNRILMIASCLGFLLASLLFALIPDPASGGRSTSFLYWAYIFPAMLGGTIGVDITFNVTNVFITTAMPRRHQAAASGLINSLLYLGIAFWLGIAELAVSAAVVARGGGEGAGAGAGALEPRAQYQIGFWTGVALSALSLCLTVTVRMGQAEAAMTADEKAELAREAHQT
ncbi:Drug resistance protein [Tolypocladium ophioglossoides CBS 100239]|uniref:Drug resistance protein n=1 Tax=Tolypocladium ophioglossoides (strain CBS 100239) TaxID=1163406 RepID=A0A0L0N143_TOLOC|nr:Drug resistance protein [Tolypocladium ophioglossoides CBS 100239]